MTSNNQCQTTNTANSNTLVMTLTANATPTISIQANPGNTICAGTNVVFTATPNNGGNAPTYQWKKNGNTVGTNSDTYADNNLTTNDSVWCILTSNSVCVITPTGISNKIKFTVNPATNVSAITGNTIGCTLGGVNSLFNATAGGVWFSSNTNTATISNLGRVTAVANGTSNINYTITNAYGCSATASVAFTVAAVAVAPVTGANSLCKNTTAQLNNATVGGVWSSMNIYATITNTGIVTGANAGNAVIRYTVTNAQGCSAYSSYNITINPIPNVPGISYAVGSINPQLVQAVVIISATIKTLR